MSFEFFIPTKSGELLAIDTPKNGYYVKKVYSADEIPELVRRAKPSLLSNIESIFDHFDVFFSVVEKASDVSPKTILFTFEVLYLTTDKLGQILDDVLKNDNLEDQERNSLRNITKMILYLVTALMKVADQIYINNHISGDKKKKGSNDQYSQMTTWNDKRACTIIQIWNVIQLPLEKLWEKSIAEEAFVTMICDLSYRTLEMNMPKSDNVSETIFQILGVAIKQYNHALQFPVRILSILRSNEADVHTIAEGICLLEEVHHITSLCGILLKDLLEMLSNEPDDSQIIKNSVVFLTRLSICGPKILMPHIQMLADSILNLEAYQLRNCILQIVGDTIRTHLTSENLSDKMKDVRDEYLEYLYDHCYDINSYVRSKVLQIWIQIKEDMAIPLVWHNRVLHLAVDRLHDKSALVRKYAVTLIRSFLERNPFAGKLSLEELKLEMTAQQKKLQSIKEKIQQNEKEWADIVNDAASIITDYLSNVANGTNEIESSQNGIRYPENQNELVMEYISKKDYLSAFKLVYYADINISNNPVSEMQTNQRGAYYVALLQSYFYMSKNHSQIQEEFEQQQRFITFQNDCFEFVDIIGKAIPIILKYLSSKISGDVCEAINFFTLGYQFDVKGAVEGMHKMLSVIWSSDKEKREAVSSAYKKVLFTTDMKGRQHSAKVVKNLCNFIGEISVGRYKSLGYLMEQWVKDEDIDLQIIQILFERFTMKLEDTTEKEARQALQLLVLISRTKSSMADANIKVIESVAFSERGTSDPLLYVSCLDFLININVNDNQDKRLSVENSLVKKVIETFHYFLFVPNIPNIYEIAAKTTQFIYCTVQSPDVVCEKMITLIHAKCKEIAVQHEDTDDDDSFQLSQNNNDSLLLKLPKQVLTRIIYCIGIYAQNELIFLDTDVYNNKRYRQELKNLKKNKINGRVRKSFVSAHDMSASNARKRMIETDEENQVGPSSEDNIAEIINFICEEVLLFEPHSILRKFTLFIIHICRNPAIYTDNELQQATIITLIRLMCVSSKFCDTNLGLLMNILNGTKNSAIKCNIIIGVTDLTFRSPNITEPWTGQFYSTLHDRNLQVRLTTVKMLSYLIMHEMIRVKGQISDLALRLVDENDDIRTCSEEFFKEVSTKSTILYNVMPEIISRLSNTSLKLEEEKYRTIMKFIMKLIHKDKHIENLVEKLCLRFNVISMERQRRDVVFCLSLLSHNEKSIKKLIENVNFFKSHIQTDEVYEAFKIIISNTSKMAKQPLKDLVNELEYKLEDFRNTFHGNEENHNQDTSQKRNSIKSMKTKKKMMLRTRRKKKSNFTFSDSDSVSDDENFENIHELRNRKGLLKSRSRGTLKNTSTFVESDISSDSELKQTIPNKKNRN